MAAEQGPAALPPVSELLRVRALSKRYLRGRRLLGPAQVVQALDGVDLSIRAGATLALVGPSGAGKSTLARCLARLEESTSGEICFEGQDLLALTGRALRWARRRIQLIFQDPAAALNPRLSAAELVGEPLAVVGHPRGVVRRRALALMERVGLPRAWVDRRPLELSGGQRQRLAIARALAAEPSLLILDEPFSGLDVSVQAQMVNLLAELQPAYRLTYLFISHDLRLMAHVADEVAVLHEGRVVERASVAVLFTCPCHPQTRALLACLPKGPAAAAGPSG